MRVTAKHAVKYAEAVDECGQRPRSDPFTAKMEPERFTLKIFKVRVYGKQKWSHVETCV